MHPGDWKITGVVMRNVPLFEAMRADGGYTLGIRGAGGLATEWIEVHDRLILASRDAPGVIAAFADPELHVVMLTITEKGYCLTPETGALDLTHSAIRGDLTGAPSGAIGLLVHGLSRRASAGLGPLTVISCDNISGNGRKLRAAVDAFAGAAGLAMHPGNSFPDTMVDRITPATTEAISGEIAAKTGRIERAPVMTEAFSEWIIEDDFAGPRPEWEKVGAELATEVAPFEMRKLRLLNAAHSYLAHTGLLAGHSFVHEAFADPALQAAVERLWDEAGATLPCCDSVFDRCLSRGPDGSFCSGRDAPSAGSDRDGRKPETAGTIGSDRCGTRARTGGKRGHSGLDRICETHAWSGVKSFPIRTPRG